MKMCRVWALLCFASLMALSRVALADEPISIVLSRSNNPADAGKTSISVTIENTGDRPVTVSKRFLPFLSTGPLPNNQFDVRSREGRVQNYIGDWDYYVGPVADGLIQLQPHQQLSGKVELRYSYAFDTQVDNRFTVQYSLPLGIVAEGNEPDINSPTYSTDPNRGRTVKSNILQLTVDPYSPLDPPAAKAHGTTE